MMKELQITIEKIASRKYAVSVTVGNHSSIQYYETTNQLFALHKSLQRACYNNRFDDFAVITNSPEFAYELQHLAGNRQRLSLITKQTLKRTKCTIASAVVKEND